MTVPQLDLVVTLAEGNARELSRTFSPGQARAPLSVGSQGEWVVSAEGVASVHLWLRFDGQRLYVASADAGAATYLQNLPLNSEWHEAADRSELRFGQACLRVSSRPVDVLSSVAPPLRAAPSRLDPRRLSPIERAAALPLPAFFGERLRHEHGSSPVTSAPRAREPRLGRALEYGASPAVAGSMLLGRPGWKWLVLIIPALGLPLILGILWVTGVGRPVSAQAAASASSAAALPRAPASVEPTPELRLPALSESPAITEAPALALPTAVTRPTPTSSPLSPTLKAYPQNVADKPVPRIGAEPGLISEEWRAHHERQLHAANRAQAKVIFLGDSITEGWGASPAYRESFAKYTPLNLGIAGDFTQNVLWRIDHGTLLGTNPEVLVLMVGVNNLAGGFSPQQTVAGIRAIVVAIQAALPKTQLLLLAILPARQKPTDPLRSRIIEANRLLASLQAPRVSFHDVGSIMLEPDGTLSNSTMRDFIHPTPAGYQLLSAAVMPLIEALLGEAAR
ncbi:MAG: GDSL-type esterase/lipase family protein [Polyangiaceae bacterium]